MLPHAVTAATPLPAMHHQSYTMTPKPPCEMEFIVGESALYKSIEKAYIFESNRNSKVWTTLITRFHTHKFGPAAPLSAGNHRPASFRDAFDTLKLHIKFNFENFPNRLNTDHHRKMHSPTSNGTSSSSARTIQRTSGCAGPRPSS